MEIQPGIDAVDLGLWIRKSKTLVLADFHIGYEEALNKQGVLVPRMQFRDITKRIGEILSRVKPDTIIINGDVKHEFGRISDQEWRETLKVIDILSKHCKKLVLVKGNHDKILGPIAEKRNIDAVDSYESGGILIIHGDKIPGNLAKYKTIIIGHEHPAVSIRESGRVEKFKCFLAGKYKGKQLIVQPSFNPASEGTDILEGNILSPFLKQNLDNFKVLIAADKIYDFGKLKNLMKN